MLWNILISPAYEYGRILELDKWTRKEFTNNLNKSAF